MKKKSIGTALMQRFLKKLREGKRDREKKQR